MENKFFIELSKLATWLVLKGIPFDFRELWGGGIIIVYDDNGNRLWDAVCHSTSIGHERGLLETMGLGGDEDGIAGDLTARQVINRMG